MVEAVPGVLRQSGKELDSLASHLSGRDELQGSEGRLEVGSVGLEIVKSASDAGLELRRVLARRAVRRDLVQSGTHDCGFCCS